MGWVKCSERLPDDSGLVLCWMYGGYWLGRYKNNKEGGKCWVFEEFDLRGEESGDVEAWIPLPEPYEGEAEV